VTPRHRYIRFFNEIAIEDVASVGGKNASLGEMYRELTAQTLRVLEVEKRLGRKPRCRPDA